MSSTDVTSDTAAGRHPADEGIPPTHVVITRFGSWRVAIAAGDDSTSQGARSRVASGPEAPVRPLARPAPGAFVPAAMVSDGARSAGVSVTQPGPLL